MPTRATPQLALDETAITDTALEAALERRLQAADDVSEVRGVYDKADEAAQALLAKHPLEVGGALRIGRFRITKRHLDGGSVEFERKASDRIRIGVVDGEQPTPIRRKANGADTEDLRPTGDVNPDALRGEADRSVTDQPPTG